jgi:hypothetical protein
MTDQQPQNEPPKPPEYKIPPALYAVTGAIVLGSILLTVFRNPYTNAVSGDYYENRGTNDYALWVAIFVGIPAAFYGYKALMAHLKSLKR